MDVFAPARAGLASLGGEAGAFASDADGHALFCENEDELFASASVIKLPLVMTLYADAARGLLDLDDERVGVERVGERLSEWGCSKTRLSRKMYDFEAAKRGHENVMTARETVSLLLRLHRGECEDRATSAAVLAVLEQCQDRTMLLRYLPYGAKVPHKTGTLDESRNDAAIVPGDRPVIVAAFTRKLRDTGAAISWLGVLGWCAYRAAGNSGDPLPPELTRTA